ncbi:hypothetical protein [Methylicorpusculum sp.]|uniref:hypothetical protein n=1 Tax=Methylicorpusculum sp. TaxID=2713644 RepID=UPI002ABBE613|nr:hypothetical protein [Methylicorpusculum sp.]MDZ4149502.1 hypothetical protein [Methylicorpusculum sp.]
MAGVDLVSTTAHQAGLASLRQIKTVLILKMLQLQRLSGRDCRNPEHKEVFGARHPWHLDLGNPCRDDDF